MNKIERTEQTVSASREKKTRQGDTVPGPAGRAEKKQKEAAETRRSAILYTAVGIFCVVLAAFLLVWNSGMIQRSAAAVTVNGEKYTAADVQYYFRTVLAENGVNSSNASSLKSIVINSETGATMYDSMMDQAVNRLTTYAALADKAQAEGYAMSADTQEYLDQQLAQLDAQWVAAGYKSRDAFIRANYGPYLTYDRFVTLYTRNLLVSDYSSAYVDTLEYTDADYKSYYRENADTLDSYTLTQFTVNASVEASDEMTEEEKTAALDEAKAQKLAVAQEIQAKLEAGESPADLGEEYADQISGDPSLSQVLTGKSVAGAPYEEWVKDGARKTGDVTISEYDAGSTGYYYYVVRFEGRQRDDAPTDTVRHILVAAETDKGASQPTEAQYDAAKAKAEELLDQWKSGPADEDSFAQLAKENSADTGSAEEGGLITDIYAGSGYVASFTEWATDDARRPGDTGIVQNTGSSTKGWHIMYYVGNTGAPVWEITAESALMSKNLNAWTEAATEGLEITKGLGMKFVQA